MSRRYVILKQVGYNYATGMLQLLIYYAIYRHVRNRSSYDKHVTGVSPLCHRYTQRQSTTLPPTLQRSMRETWCTFSGRARTPTITATPGVMGKRGMQERAPKVLHHLALLINNCLDSERVTPHQLELESIYLVLNNK